MPAEPETGLAVDCLIVCDGVTCQPGQGEGGIHSYEADRREDARSCDGCEHEKGRVR